MKIAPLVSSTFTTATAISDVKWVDVPVAKGTTGGGVTPTSMQEGEWYNIKIFVPTSVGCEAALVIEDSAGEPVHGITSDADETPENINTIKLKDFGNPDTSTVPSQPNEGVWYGYDAEGLSLIHI